MISADDTSGRVTLAVEELLCGNGCSVGLENGSLGRAMCVITPYRSGSLGEISNLIFGSDSKCFADALPVQSNGLTCLARGNPSSPVIHSSFCWHERTLLEHN